MRFPVSPPSYLHVRDWQGSRSSEEECDHCLEALNLKRYGIDVPGEVPTLGVRLV